VNAPPPNPWEGISRVGGERCNGGWGNPPPLSRALVGVPIRPIGGQGAPVGGDRAELPVVAVGLVRQPLVPLLVAPRRDEVQRVRPRVAVPALRGGRMGPRRSRGRPILRGGQDGRAWGDTCSRFDDGVPLKRTHKTGRRSDDNERENTRGSIEEIPFKLSVWFRGRNTLPPPISLEEVARSPTPPAPCIAPTGHPLNPRPGDAWNRWQGAYPQPYPHAYTSHGSLPTPKRSGSMGRRRRRRATHAAAPTTHRALQAEDFVGELHRRLPRPVLVDHGLGGEAGGEDGDEGQGRRTPPPCRPATVAVRSALGQHLPWVPNRHGGKGGCSSAGRERHLLRHHERDEPALHTEGVLGRGTREVGWRVGWWGRGEHRCAMPSSIGCPPAHRHPGR